jgi:adenosylcobinamide-GDP ribazoletransferase
MGPLLLAVQFLTRLPVRVAFTPAGMAAAPGWFPLVGMGIGAAAAAVHAAALLVWPAPIAVLLCLAATLLLTGALHEDGLADTADGLGGGATRERALDIMRDSRIGTYGAVALILAVGLKVAALMALPVVAAALIAAHGLSRFSSVLVMATSPYAREAGAASGMAAPHLALPCATALACVALLAWAFGGVAALGALAGLAAAHLALRRVAERRLGGYTGDTLGAVQQVSEVAIYLGVLACL